MSLRLVAPSAMYADDAKKIVRPFVAARKLRDSFSSSWINIQGFGQYVTPFGNRDLQLSKLIRDVEEGRVFLLDDSNGFGTVEGCIGGSDSFCSRVNAIKSSGRRRPVSGVSYEPAYPSVNLDEYTPEPIKPEEPAEQQERTEFLCGWSESQKNQSKADAIAALLPSKYQQDKRALIDRHNEHLKNSVREGEIIVLPTREPKTEDEHAQLNELKVEARKVSTALHSVSEEEAQTAVRFFPLLDYLGTKDFYSEALTVAGSVVSGFGAILESMLKDIRAINQIFIDEVLTSGSLKSLPKSFYDKRAILFKRLDSSLHKMMFKCVGIRVFTKLKNTLGLSKKSIAYHGKDLLNADGVLKGLGQRMEAIVGWIRKANWVGKVGVVLDALFSVPVIKESFTSREGDPVKTISIEAARVYGGYLGGSLGYKAGAAVVTAGLSAVGVAGSPLVLGIGAIVGAVGGAYAGAKLLSPLAKGAVEMLYNLGELSSENGGFFDWNAEQI